MGKLSPLRRRMIEDMRVRNLSPATQEAYVRAVEKLSRHFGRSPDRLNLEDVRAFQVHLASQGNAWSTVNQTVCALRFFYGVTLGRERMPKHLAYAHEPSKLPVVLSASEVARFLAAVPSVRSRAVLTTAYAAGLRVSEAVSLKITDVDSERMIIRVEHGKGGKSLPRRRPGTVTSCSRHGSWRCCAPIGASPGRGTGCFPDGMRAGRSIRYRYTAPVVWPRWRRASISGSPCIHCATVLRHICWRTAPTSASFSCCSGTATCRRRRATRRWQPARSMAR